MVILGNYRATFVMHLMYTLDEDGNRVYTLKVCLSSEVVIVFNADGLLENDRQWQDYQVCTSW